MTKKITRKRNADEKRAPANPDSLDELAASDDAAGIDAAPLESRAIDPLAAEPLTSDEIEEVQRRDPDLAEEDERAMQALQQTTEATMPVDAQSDDPIELSADQELEIRRRPRAKDDTARAIDEDDETARPRDR